MKIAILSVTEKGLKLSEVIQSKLNDDYTVIKADIYHKNVMKNMKNVFNKYDAIISIMATGITIRAISPYIQSKVLDPAVLAIDEKGQYVVSLLSGHLGGGNDLTCKIAKYINGKPVISTSTDVNLKCGIDSIASKYFYEIDDTKKIIDFNKAILDNISFSIKSDKDLSHLTKYFPGSTFKQVPKHKLSFNHREITDNIPLSIVNFSFKKNNQIYEMNMIEKKLVIGIGSKRGMKKEHVIFAIEEAIKNLNIPLSRVNSIATISIKKDEIGIIKAAHDLNKKIEIIDIYDVRNFHSDDCSRSEFVYKKFQIDGVCEQCAMIAAGHDSKLIHKKCALNGVTVAVAISK
ncbi:cobalt-precorrin 5A hydrolase [uncultured Methanobrevibacter sp.]|uniref:cobalt-precorrin 5A hydrolase n=1 Tax=uncultured Methanobrevibacter sp. TaxID=253161 RepID=UPI0025CB812C|nr:cobalamin biosynthesis protein [uncultured Methanobrevibacter sp.]